MRYLHSTTHLIEGKAKFVQLLEVPGPGLFVPFFYFLWNQGDVYACSSVSSAECTQCGSVLRIQIEKAPEAGTVPQYVMPLLKELL